MTREPIDAAVLLEELARIDSRNPDLSPDSAGERALAERVAQIVAGLGMDVRLIPVLDDRPNLVAVLPGVDSDATVIFEAHLDTVPADAGTREVRREGRRLYGRGTCDTKGSLAAMIAAIDRLSRTAGPRPTVLLACAVDEEYLMRGAGQLATELPSADVVVVGEPTSLVPARAHNGFLRFRVEVLGRSAHSSRAALGVNAINQAARLVLALDATVGERRRASPHPLAGHALLSATMVDGGIAPNVIPDRCSVLFDRRVAPGERPEEALAEAYEAIAQICERESITVELPEPLVSLGALETPPDAVAVVAAEAAASRALGRDVSAGGVTFSTDACCFYDRPDLPSVVLGPGSIDEAHGSVEWIELDDVDTAVRIYYDLAMTAHTIRQEHR
ncbi:M20/M25/M40 family metallo-hydrolase [Cellulomonas fengjieae]|uniref:M20/M25/M40 family metallo-hydrolase n=1 Tax=Cellulomonas fengjieae TaxID=2819978 RepID=A0ABS3SG58_9CELL|nr:M20/M25/M40 family metallo-hydrolase [Cellulomonas fengjieae]MBO3084733.1 M20/M25/M40 family metallo-hydrolase [Cellulomonas fengjieae]MBO3103705.1 M20/M25/M40 family metallo-hydrolase [Cellulomonas fengjieae]QVI66945.1 M20/M25/M40 family metallo-hydrolase [Cellulomonas fengjieae]